MIAVVISHDHVDIRIINYIYDLFYSRDCMCMSVFFFFQAEDGIRDLVRSRGLGDVYKRQTYLLSASDQNATFCESNIQANLNGAFSGMTAVSRLSLIHI